MRPLVFLFVRSFINGVKRALTSPRRLISLIVFGLYYFNLFVRPFSSSPAIPQNLPRGGLHLQMPRMEWLDGAVFGAMALVSVLMMSGLLGYRGGFKPADVDVLFPTPVSPRMVLIFRIVRDYLLTLLLPLFFAVIGWRGTTVGWQLLFDNFPKESGNVMRAVGVAWLLMSLAWVALGYAASLFVNRSDLASDRNRKWISNGILVAFISVALFIAVRLRIEPGWATALSITQSPFLRIIFLPATAASAVVMGSLQGNWIEFSLGLAGLAAIIALGLRIALTQVDWMYDQAAARGFESVNLRNLQRSGDTYGVIAERARKGKFGRSRIATAVGQMRVRGAPALVWKETILQARSAVASSLVMGLFMAGIVGLTMWTAGRSPNVAVSGGLLLGLQGAAVFMISLASAQGGFIELLRRVDFQKPLPFTPTTIVFWEVAAKAVVPTFVCGFSAIVGVVIAPSVWQFGVASILLVPSFTLLLVSTVFLAVVLFPDIDDPTQRGFRGLIMMLAIVIFSSPGVALLAALIYLGQVSPIIAAVPVMLISLAITLAVASFSGTFYATFNPSE